MAGKSLKNFGNSREKNKEKICSNWQKRAGK